MSRLLFLSGFLFRFLLLLIVIPQPASEWYIPFLTHSIQNITLDPWGDYLRNGGDSNAFPYGYIMWFIFLPFTLISSILNINIYFAYGITLLITDLALFFTLKKLYELQLNFLIKYYWLSPIVLFSTYLFGFNDLIPITLSLLSLYFLRKNNFTLCGALCALAVSAKLSMIITLPFIIIYFYRNKAIRYYIDKFIFSFASAFFICFVPYFFYPAGLMMLVSNPEIIKVYQLTIEFGSTIIYLLPLAYILILYLMWRVKRVSFKLLNVILGISFFLVVLLTPASPGWYIWIVPILVLFQSKSGKATTVLTLLFSIFFLICTSASSKLITSITTHNLSDYIFGFLFIFVTKHLPIFQTLLFALGLILIFRIWREAVLNDDYFRISRTPLLIGITGDSGSGKDTLVILIKKLFGEHSIVNLSGDDYHFWDRKKPIWQVITHLNPKANDLEQFAKDLIDLSNDKSIRSRYYDHESGQRGKFRTLFSNDIIIASGLHALHLPILRNCYDVAIYLDIDENLRRYFKIHRDVNNRGHSFEKVINSFKIRELDSIKFIRPQLKYADLVFSLIPMQQVNIDNFNVKTPIRLKLVARSIQSMYEESLIRVLIGICGLHVDMALSNDGREVELSIEGEASSDDVALAAKSLFYDIREFLDLRPQWEDGVQGLMQLITLSHINQAFKRRLI